MKQPRLAIERYAGPADATTIYTFVDDPLLFRVVSVFVSVTQIGTSTILPMLTVLDLLDGVATARARFNPGIGGTAGAGATLQCTFGVMLPDKPFDAAFGVWPAPVTGLTVMSAPVPPDLWVPPQTIMTMQLCGAAAGGSGVGDMWDWVGIVKERIVDV